MAGVGFPLFKDHSNSSIVTQYSMLIHCLSCTEENRLSTDIVVSYPTLSANRHFISHYTGSGKDWAQNRCMRGVVDLIRQLITDSLIKNYCQVLRNASVKIHWWMQIEDRYKQFRDYPLDTAMLETNRWKAVNKMAAGGQGRVRDYRYRAQYWKPLQ